MRTIAPEDRRRKPRHDVEGLLVCVRRKGRLAKLIGMAVDFNRFGLAVVTDQPLSRETLVYLSITTPMAKIDNVIGVVHNCISQDTGYRCGIQFRTASPLQDEPSRIEHELTQLEYYFETCQVD